MGHGGDGQVVSELVFHSKVPDSNPKRKILEIFPVKAALCRTKQHEKRLEFSETTSGQIFERLFGILQDWANFYFYKWSYIEQTI